MNGAIDVVGTGVFQGPIVTLLEVVQALAEHTLSRTVVFDPRENLLGILTLSDIERVPRSERTERLVEQIMNRDALSSAPDDTLDVALEQLASHRVGWMPVVEVDNASGGRRVLGRISALDITRVYRQELAKGSRRMRGMVEGTAMVEIRAEPGTRLVSRPLREVKLPPQCLVVATDRHHELIFQRGGSIIEPGDLVTFLVSPNGEEQLCAYLEELVEHTEASVLD